MFIPIGDGNPLKRIPFQLVTASLVAACVIVYFYQLSLPYPLDVQFVLGYGIIPSLVIGDESLPARFDAAPTLATLVTYQFLHGGFLHLVGNMLFLWVFGDNVEDAMGHLRFLAFYILCGVLAAGAHMVGVGATSQPLIGASGAVSGVIAAYLMLYPRGKVLILAFNWFPIRLPVWLVLGFWIALQVWSFAGSGSDGGGVAWLAHIGGLVAGAALLPLMKGKDVPLFQREAVAATLTPGTPAPASSTNGAPSGKDDATRQASAKSGARAGRGSVPSTAPRRDGTGNDDPGPWGRRRDG
ncbi:rhomboid family intramembrane serine protease [Marivibrio halodurans]|uniref:Rhomboid family intramembrane serine protease n=1 Tax=Marivibrio halodurans TaxID=2039722 RepID=A0A8J7RZL4_9PROT|nr:rhomboid family intramembrane serine protease [Marivibrio halodurans]MBP5855973.1 rhomboid family intramembrane serine protease [Marivibrio halodurans]